MTSGLARFLPPLAIFLPPLVVGAILSYAGRTLGYDYFAYVGAARRVLEGAQLYDPSVNVAGGFAIYLYPPPFALAFVPFALLPDDIGVPFWTLLLVAATVAAIGLMPIPATARWLLLLVGGISWPVAYSIKLGQVGPILLLAFVVGWRWIDRPRPLGLSIAGGTLVKIQPVAHVLWAILTRRWAAAAVALGIIAAACLLATLLLGPGVWADYAALLARVGSSPITTPHNFTPGAVAYAAGLSEAAAASLQLAVTAAVVVVVIAAALRSSAEASFVTTAVASQLISPVLWDHYSMLLLLPVGYLLGRRHWWAALVPLAFWLPVAATYPLLFVVGLIAPALVGGRESAPSGPSSTPASAPA